MCFSFRHAIYFNKSIYLDLLFAIIIVIALLLRLNNYCNRAIKQLYNYCNRVIN